MKSTVVISEASQKSLMEYVTRILSWNSGRSNFKNKLEAIDTAYARYKEAEAAGNQDGIDRYGSHKCNATTKEVTNPIVISTVDSQVGYWAEVFLSGYPLFPVVTTPEMRQQAEALEGILQDHVTLSQSVAEMNAYRDWETDRKSVV